MQIKPTNNVIPHYTYVNIFCRILLMLVQYMYLVLSLPTHEQIIPQTYV